MAAFVLGNGVSRRDIDVNYLISLGNVYGCNALYRTHTPTALVATDHPIAREIQESGYSSKQRFYTRRPLPNYGAQVVPKPYFGFSSGPIAVAVAAADKNPEIYLLGFDLGANQHGKFNNLYASTQHYKPENSTPTYTGNWIKQLIRVMQDFSGQQFTRVLGPTTADVAEFKEVKNYSTLPLELFLERINNKKDL